MMSFIQFVFGLFQRDRKVLRRRVQARPARLLLPAFEPCRVAKASSPARTNVAESQRKTRTVPTTIFEEVINVPP